MTQPPTGGRGGGERGIVTVEFVAVIWLFMILATEGGTPTASQTRALDLLRAGLGRDAASATVQVHRNAELAQVTVTAHLRPLLPIGGAIRLRATANSFAEGFRPTP